jgi:hypothetical protein
MAHSDDFKLIREIVAAGGRKHTIGTLDPAKYQHLVELGCSSHSRHPPATCLIGSPNAEEQPPHAPERACSRVANRT